MNCYVRAVFRAASRNRRCLLHRPDFLREIQARCYAASSITGERLIYDVMGDPSHVLRCEKYEVNQPKGKEVLVETMAAPINPADINTIQGVYAVKPPLPAVPGSEAVGRVVAVGPAATESSPDKLKPGDIVITRQTGMGVWSSHILSDAQSFYKLPTTEVSSDDQLATVATLSVNPCTAYRMLVDFEKLSPGDVVVQNGANSAVGQAVIQIAKSMGLKTLNIVRDRSDFDSLKSFLTELGADWVCRDNDEAGIKALGLHRKVKLGLNCVAGKSGIQMMKLLAPGSNIVLYGGMSRQPLVVPVSFLIFTDIRVRGFWMTAWKAANEKKRATSKDFEEMMDHLWGLVKDGHLRPPKHRFVKLGDYRTAVKDAMPEGGRGNDKIIFKFQ